MYKLLFLKFWHVSTQAEACPRAHYHIGKDGEGQAAARSVEAERSIPRSPNQSWLYHYAKCEGQSWGPESPVTNFNVNWFCILFL